MRISIKKVVKKAKKFLKSKPETKGKKDVAIYNVITPETISKEASAFKKVFG